MISRFRVAACAALFIAGCLGAGRPIAAAPRALPEGKTPDDRRLGPLKDLNGYFPFHVCDSPEAWRRRADHLRRQLRVALGLWPTPAKTPANAVVHGKVDRDEYTVEKVYLESFPGHFVTGNLYRPKGKAGPRPGVLCPHGHWPNGRFHDAGEAKVRQEVASGAELFEIGGRSPLQARCVQLARMGCVVFHYDMIGYADSVQLAHRPGYRKAMSGPSDWGYFSPQAELRLQNMMGLQSYNSIRALDWLSELDDVDPKRIAVTGASGGGTQTFILAAIDPRPAVAFPAVMVSTAMQGGCTCENAPYLRVGTGNVEIAALFSPKPLGVTAANDWTKEMPTKGFPELQQHYAMLGAKDNTMLMAAVQFGHNYNAVSRAAMYHWLNKRLGLGVSEPIKERDYKPLTVAEMSVWDKEHPKPASGDAYERSLLRTITEDSENQIKALEPRDTASLAKFREVVGGGWKVLIGRESPAGDDVEWKNLHEVKQGDYVEFAGLIRNKPQHEETPTIFLHPNEWEQKVVIWLDERGKAGLYGADGKPIPAVQKLLDAGCAVAGVDLFMQGEFLGDGKSADTQRLLSSGRGAWAKYTGYTFGYNQSLFAQRVSDVLTLISYIRNHHGDAAISLVGLRGAGPWAAAAAAQAPQALQRAAIDTGGFRFASLTAIDDPNFVPGAVKYADVPGLLALAAPTRLWIAGEGKQTPALVAASYRAAGKPDSVTVYSGTGKEQSKSLVSWLLD